MIQRTLGKTGLNVSVVGFGGIPIQRLEEDKAVSLVKLSIEKGMNFIDTARAYGQSEKMIGLAIENANMRKKCYIATKSTSRDYESMKKDIETSLRNLKCDVIDLYQCHLVKTQEQFDQILSPNGAYPALKEAQEAGLIKNIGITSHDYNILDMALDTKYFSTIQFPYNIVERQGEALFEKAAKKNIGVIIMKPLAGGALDDGDLALKFILNNNNISVVIPGMDSEQQVIENSKVGKETSILTVEERQKLEKIQKELSSNFCRRCGYCLPCPQNIDIPSAFLMEGYYSRYNLKNWALERYNALPNKASECIKCGKCEPNCPYDLPIREMLKDVVEKLEAN
ncbi:aldo/keto reductase [Serpentinicella sp. ANB-PHB4]|uniref:aldo/keto reductase n=1 Tax=Serpentinicella sp. ANB-PHB4 TaxID=3074076 RepID=UPI0028658B30|nr:aldo/keto reductase [Serpentinicella sp. ANB-PHB4]MDR5658512.1 aldo/keto reductase [Serpentinicella sp. ANB-PHB4]